MGSTWSYLDITALGRQEERGLDRGVPADAAVPVVEPPRRVPGQTKYAVLMFSDPDRTRAMPEDELDEILRKHDALREELTRSDELLNGAGSKPF